MEPCIELSAWPGSVGSLQPLGTLQLLAVELVGVDVVGVPVPGSN